MAYTPDGRGSKGQRILFDWAKQLYNNFTIIYEQLIPELNQRYDIFVKDLGVAIEYDGIQHNKFVEHFHKSTEGYVAAKKRDMAKDKFSEENGVKVVRIPYNYDFETNSPESLKKLIDSIPYPESEYNFNVFEKETPRRLLKAREIRKNAYQKFKKSVAKR